jgi:uncharacterized protein DUF3291
LRRYEEHGVRVAFTTCGLLEEPYGGPRNADFEALTPEVFRAAEAYPGFLERADYADDRDDLGDPDRAWGKWGPLQLPSFYEGGQTDETYLAAQTLSVWRDLASVSGFVFSGIHASALRRRHEWFVRPTWPTYAIWWIDDGHTPTWAEACGRLEILGRSGPTRAAFDLKHAFDQHGGPARIERVDAESGRR